MMDFKSFRDLSSEEERYYKEILKFLADHMDLNFFIIAKDGHYILKSPKLESMLGEIDRADIFDKKSWKDCQAVMQSGEGKTIEERYKDYWFLSIKSPLIKEGELEGVIGIAIDITERKKMEKRLAEAKQKAEAATKAKSEFLANMSHDIRTPLIGMVGLAERLHQTIQEAKPKILALQLIELSKNLLEVSNELIEGAQSESGKLPILNQPFDLKKTMESAESLLRPLAQAKKLDFQIDCSAFQNNFRWIGDAKRIRRIILNLTSNAIKFTEQGFVKTHIQVEKKLSKKEEYCLTIKVQDSGPGIPEDKRHQIFQRFAQLNASNDNEHSGFGIGLNIVHQFLKDLHGTIDLHSKEGEGSTFICTIPIEIPKVIDLKPLLEIKEKTVEYASLQPNFPPLHVLLVEDNEIAAFALKHQLEQFRFIVDEVKSAEDALECFTKNSYDLVFTDLNLLDKEGYWLANSIRSFEKTSSKKSAIIVGLSAHLDKKKENQCIQSGMNIARLKPLTREDLLNLLNLYFPSAQDETTQVIDLQTSAKNFYANDLKIAQKMLRNLVEGLPLEQERMDKSFAKKDWKRFYHRVHNLYGGCVFCGVPSLTEALAALQKVLRKKSIMEVATLYQKVVVEMQRLDEAYKKMFGSV